MNAQNHLIILDSADATLERELLALLPKAIPQLEVRLKKQIVADGVKPSPKQRVTLIHDRKIPPSLDFLFKINGLIELQDYQREQDNQIPSSIITHRLAKPVRLASLVELLL